MYSSRIFIVNNKVGCLDIKYHGRFTVILSLAYLQETLVKSFSPFRGMCSVGTRDHRPSEVPKRQEFSSQNRFFSSLSERGDGKYFKACPSVKVVTQNIRKSDLAMVHIMWNMAQEPDPTLETRIASNYLKFSMLFAEKSICPRYFCRGT